MKLNYTERAVFLISDYHCNIKNKYLRLLGSFLGGSWVFQGYFKIISRVFSCDSVVCVCNGSFKGVSFQLSFHG